MICTDTSTHGVGVWVVGWVSGSMGEINDLQLNKSLPNQDNLVLFEDL